MRVNIDGENLVGVDSVRVESGSWERAVSERSAIGIDGVLSVDLGKRGRKVKHNGVIRAVNQLVLDEIIDSISAFMDGSSHSVSISGGESFDDLRMDSFAVKNKRSSGAGLVCDFEIIYKQLAD